MVDKLLLVDDDLNFLELLDRLFHDRYDVEMAICGSQALESATRRPPDLVLLDVCMPGMDGYEVCRRLKAASRVHPPQVIMISACSSRQEQLTGFQVGADDYLVKPIDPCELEARVRLHLRLIRADRMAETARNEIAARHHEFEELIEQRASDMAATKDIAVLALAEVAESRDEDTGEHLMRMRAYSQLIAEQLRRDSRYSSQISSQFLEDLFRSSPLHDIGKVGISDAILLKPARLTPHEYEIVKQHTTIGANILDNAVFHSPHGSFLAMAALIARFHHERFDGAGYPAGLVGREIPLPARIVAVADVFDAISSRRPYKPAYPAEMAREMIEAEAGRHFDPEVVSAFLERFDEVLELRRQYDQEFPLRKGAMSFREHEIADLLEV